MLKNVLNTIIIVIYFMAVVLPPLVMIVTPTQEFTFVEKRALAPKPVFDPGKALRDYLDEVEAFFDDHFGFRDQLISSHSWLSFFIFNVATDERVTVSEAGDIFYFNQGYNGIYMLEDYHRGVTPDLPPHLLEKFRSDLEKKRDFLADHGIAYYLLIAPDKQTIYRNQLSDSYSPHSNATWFDQINAYLEESSDIAIIDVRAEMLAAAEHETEPLFFPYGSHWTSAGAWIGYEVTMERLREDFPDIETVDPAIFSVKSPLGDSDLAQFSGLGEWLSTPELRYMHAAESCAVSIEEPNHHERLDIVPRRIDERDLLYFRCDQAPNQYTLMMFRNSYALALQPFFTESFETSAYVWDGYKRRIMEQAVNEIEPDIVIEQWVERNLVAYFAFREFEPPID